jgi:hypothetical protein
MRAVIEAAGSDATGETEGAFSFNDYAKHWGEAKGFGLWFQFNPHSMMSDDDFADLHDLLGQTMPSYVPGGGGDYMTYYSGLEEARDIICTAYAFEADNCAGW